MVKDVIVIYRKQETILILSLKRNFLILRVEVFLNFKEVLYIWDQHTRWYWQDLLEDTKKALS